MELTTSGGLDVVSRNQGDVTFPDTAFGFPSSLMVFKEVLPEGQCKLRPGLAEN